MREYLTIGSCPHDEKCEQLGPTFNKDREILEIAAFCEQIMRHYPAPAFCHAEVRAKSFNHDFGRYREVCVIYNDNDEKAIDYAFSIEGDEKGVLSTWDDKAREFLVKRGYMFD